MVLTHIRIQVAMSAIALHSLGRHEEERQMRQFMIDKEGQFWAFLFLLSCLRSLKLGAS